MASFANHVSDEELARVDEDDAGDRAQIRAHLEACESCRLRRDEVKQLRALLARTGNRERRPPRSAVPGAMMRLRLRRNGVTGANELLEGLVAFMCGLASLFSLPATEEPRDARTRGGRDDTHG